MHPRPEWSAALLLLLAPFAAAKALWSSTPATFATDADEGYILRTGYPLGNGKLGAIPFGPPGSESLMLNLDSLWSGGPFEAANYTGGNTIEPVYQYLPGIREWIFQNGTGNVTALLNDLVNFGYYQTLGNLSVAFAATNNNNTDGSYTDYRRELDLDTGVHTSSWTSNGAAYETSVFCSYPALSCVYHVNATQALPPVTISLTNKLRDRELVNSTCGSGYARLTGLTQASIGLKFDAIARVVSGNLSSSTTTTTTSCSDETGALTIVPTGQTALTIVVSAETNYDQKKGSAADDYSFRGADPGPVVERRTAAAAAQSHAALRAAHVADYAPLMAAFALDLPDTAGSAAGGETAALVARYADSGSDPYLESLMVDYSRHLLVSSSREGALPPELQGRWTESLTPAWQGAYALDVNTQMNYWGAEQTGLGALARPVFEFMADTWVPRGVETARLVYNGSGWVAHNEINIYGYTGFEGGGDNAAQWADYPASAAWMMQHVFDHYDYNRNLTWLSETGYPLLKGVASFWLSQLQDDAFFNDGSLVVNPCNSPEQGPTTFGCTHSQQLIHQVFEAVLATAPLVADNDTNFQTQVAESLSRLDKGIHIDAEDTGVLKEWKAPDSYLYNVYPQHRHISHLVGWFPGYSISGFAQGYTNASLQDAVRATLVARGDGTSTDGNGGNYGWPKVWRGAAWARLNDSSRAYEELQLALSNNVAPNLLSMYAGRSPPFQIDMNFGWAGNVLSMLVVDLPLDKASEGGVRTVVLGPAVPAAWGGGSVKGLRIRGGVVVDFEWDAAGVVSRKTVVSGKEEGLRFVNVNGEVL